ncbi:MAG TPA: DeoR/GlpR family DNA-binding transcription regulator [Candidatus Saccharimonadales bacterium]|nr:DeoR/GlpR family DNA-binding transcription regulator [Candidatus Saccharimonadales bacterium]
MLNEERRRSIVEVVQRNGRAIVSELARQLGTSEITIRRDLDALQDRGLIHRTHGGALCIQSGSEADHSLIERELQHPREKLRIAVAAAKLVKEGQSVLLDSGSTTTAIARQLRSFQQLTVITNAINIAGELAGGTVDVILTGGMLRKNSFSLIGPLAEDSLAHLKADILFMGVEGIDPRFGVSTSNMLEAVLNRKMVAAAQQVIAVCDSSKLGRRSLSSIVPITSIDQVVTDKQAPEKMLDELRKAGIKIITT